MRSDGYARLVVFPDHIRDLLVTVLMAGPPGGRLIFNIWFVGGLKAATEISDYAFHKVVRTSVKFFLIQAIVCKGRE